MWKSSRLRRRPAHSRHNPLLRRADRIENLFILAVIVLAFAMLPIAIFVGVRTVDSQVALAEQQAQEYRTVTATTLADSAAVTMAADTAPSTLETAPAKWMWGDDIRRADITVAPSTPAGTREQVWVDGEGDLTAPPMSTASARVGGVIAGIFTWFAVMMIAFSAFLIAKVSLNRSRDAQWDRDLRRFFDSTTRH
ncbi:MAG: hypothetical protein WAW17_32795 [Rhodococcus sp. (in: high G+C Gram-positive bacteria)]|uniref:Rv1733c family protein n=1 Tax=Rhodococcus sp. TaxID=1831 RepID=UPI003BAF3E2E